LPGVRFEIDEARSWFANAAQGQNFDLVQMSMIDTWAATGVGAYSLSENGLYTVEGWRRFLASLAPVPRPGSATATAHTRRPRCPEWWDDRWLYRTGRWRARREIRRGASWLAWPCGETKGCSDSPLR
jgi:hypothetical protein